jgi:hypothetical protein
MLWRDMRGRTNEEKHKEIQDLDPNRFPHLEEIMIGGDVDLDLLSLFPQIDSKSMGGKESRAASSKSTMEERECGGEATVQGEEWDLL